MGIGRALEAGIETVEIEGLVTVETPKSASEIWAKNLNQNYKYERVSNKAVITNKEKI